ncbi:ABC-three component system middle component 7 [Tolumonas auensis]|uniref:ABC-three component system middle component 7 n=1 Tax=Tolumonas auensis TaxID=43948 RepID=UPI0039843C38
MITILEIDFVEINLISLYKQAKSNFTGLDEFIYALDVLYILGKIDINEDLGKIIKC